MTCKDCIYFWQEQDANCSEGSCCCNPDYVMRDANMPACEPMMREAKEKAEAIQNAHG